MSRFGMADPCCQKADCLSVLTAKRLLKRGGFSVSKACGFT